MSKMILCQGLQGSGKSTWAKEQVEKSNGQCKIISRDSLRDMLDNGKWSESKEKHIRKSELLLAEYFFHQGFNLIIDDLNLSYSAQTMWQEFARKTGMTLEVKNFTNVPIEECIKRDLKRPNSVGEKVIRETYRRYLYTPLVPPPDNPALPYACIVDMDGTLALIGDRSPYDTAQCEDDLPNSPVIATIQRAYHAGDRILITSGREDLYRPQTERWLKRYLFIPYDLLLMRETGDARKDAIVKREMYERYILHHYNVRLVLDDRNQMIQLWREELGLPCFQVADGNF